MFPRSSDLATLPFMASDRRRIDIGALDQMIVSFEISLQGAGKSAKTQETYLGQTTRFAAYLYETSPEATWWDVRRADIERWIGSLIEQKLSASYVNQHYRSLQQFFRWFADEEDVDNPYAKLRPPPLDDTVVPVLSTDQLSKLVKDAERSKDFTDRRDAAILRLFASSGARLNEIASLLVADVDLRNREAVVMGKGRKQRTVKFDTKAAQAVDRYLRSRSAHKHAARPEMWVGLSNDTALQPKSIYRAIARRGQRLGIKVYPHMFRHTFSHNWLDKGGAEGDLMELNGWQSAQMLARYGRSARSARARRAFDRINVMDGI